MTSEIKPINIKRLSLNKDNPRFDPVETSEEAYALMMEEKGDEIYNLAEHIAYHGMDPSRRMILFEDPAGNLILKDGNRRLSAITAILDPDKIPIDSSRLREKFRALQRIAPLSDLERIDCAVFIDEDEADKWVNIQHTGKNKGIGTDDWDGMSTARANSGKNGENMPPAYLALKLVEKNAADNLKTKLNFKFPITNLDRLLVKYGDFRKDMGFTIIDGKLHYRIPQEEAMKNLMKVVEEILDPNFSVNTIKTKTEVNIFKKKLQEQGYMKSGAAELEKPIPVELAEVPTEQSKEILAKKTSKKKEKKATTRRTYLIPSDYLLVIEEDRINNIYQELKRLNVESFPNAVSVLFRVFLELSIDHYSERNHVHGIGKNTELINKIHMVHDHFDRTGVMTRDEMQGLMQLCNTTNEQPICLTREFNGYVHNFHLHPDPAALKVTWDNLQTFISKLWY